MTYPESVQALLEAAGVEEGDEVRVRTDGREERGVVMPHHAFSGDAILTLKLANGYNVGLRVDADTVVEKVAPARERPARELPVDEDPSKPTVAFLGTGGTIASYVDYRTGAVYPALTAEELVAAVPSLPEVCNVRAKILFSLLSEDMRAVHWQELARKVADELNGGAKAVVVAHGTDTLGYTAAALSFMLSNLTGPVVLVGSQRSSDRPSSDAFLNLLCAARLATADLGEVVAVMHENPSDLTCTVHRGTKVRKMHSSRRDAFRTVNDRPLGRVHRDGSVEWGGTHATRSEGDVVADTELEPRVSLVYTHPELRPGVFETVARESRGVVVAGTGLGHVAEELLSPIRQAIRDGVPVVMTSQSLYGRVGPYVYSRGRELTKAGVIPAEDMLPETALVKLMWILGHTSDMDEIRDRMERDLAGEINPRLELPDFEI